MSQPSSIKMILSTIGLMGGFSMLACAETPMTTPVEKPTILPAEKFDLSQWKITVPLDKNRDGKVDEIDVRRLAKYHHPDFFYIDDNGDMVFTSPNLAATTSGSSNSRSELRQMLRGKSTKQSTKGPKNNFAIAAHKKSSKFASVGGKLEATLKVNHVALHAGNPKEPAYSVVVGQIHAGKDSKLLSEGDGFGWGNEPIKIFYKKWPNHKTGSVFWNYERNLAKDDPNRTDIDYPIWGNKWDNPEDPGEAGLLLGEEFSYVINVHKNIMDLTFTSPNKATVRYQIDLSNNIDAYGNIDEKDHPKGYTGDWHYFKAGAYNQCSVKDAEGIWYTACAGTGNWEKDKANGDYTSVAFSHLVISDSTPPTPILPEERLPETAGSIEASMKAKMSQETITSKVMAPQVTAPALQADIPVKVEEAKISPSSGSRAAIEKMEELEAIKNPQ